MIQRVQTLYLLLTTILVGILLFTPFAIFNGAEVTCQLSAWSLRIADGDGAVLFEPNYALGIVLSATALLPLITLLLYRKRRLQMRLCLVEILLLLASMGTFIYYYIMQDGRWIDGTVTPQSILLIVAILPVVAARRRIAKDEALVKSLDRIR